MVNISDLEASLMSSSVVTCSLLRKEAGKLEVESFGKTGRTMPLKISRSHFQEVRRSLSSPSSEVRGIILVSRVFLAFKESNSIWSRFISDSVTVVFSTVNARRVLVLLVLAIVNRITLCLQK